MPVTGEVTVSVTTSSAVPLVSVVAPVLVP
jgi:hypothetical protein